MRQDDQTPPHHHGSFRSEAFIKQAMEVWGGSVWRVALAQTGSKFDAEEVYQDVFIRLAKNQTDFAGPEHLKAWLLRVAVNRCHDVARGNRRRPTVPIDDLPFEPAENGSLDQGAIRELWEAVEALPESMRTIIHLFYYEGYSGDEVANLLQLKPSTVRSRLYRARIQLKTALGGANHGESQRIQIDDGSRQAACSSE